MPFWKNGKGIYTYVRQLSYVHYIFLLILSIHNFLYTIFFITIKLFQPKNGNSLRRTSPFSQRNVFEQLSHVIRRDELELNSVISFQYFTRGRLAIIRLFRNATTSIGVRWRFHSSYRPTTIDS